MSEYMEPHSISKLIGSPPGYVGYSSNNEFANKINSLHSSIILFDEIEKAHKSINDLMLQILEEGRLTLSNGNILKFNNSFIIFTSNLGCDSSLIYTNKIEYNNNILQSIKNFFRPEFISRLNNIIIFEPVNIFNCDKIVNNIIKKINLNNNSNFNLHNNIKKEFINYSYNILYGLRPVYRLNELINIKLGHHNNKINFNSVKNNSYIICCPIRESFKYNINSYSA
ncbi:hypothetical protein BcabD6B2_59010 (apicoplast) [Babesia caballi]|uniref:ATPase AAA-type core domain-containing protein n=1 Tax=Babesia caballi TaxID=5871 RepID=A0AAV4M6K0_BABCB|nr:hypothetical protein BcabD6B2_59010 [Babesia caballi]